jgi:ubiquinone/menaquinone biosynthesis C-methylase UbiE
MSYPSTIPLESLRIKRRYDLISNLYDLIQFPVEMLFFAPWRKMIFSEVKAERILEIGVGTGRNFKFYPTGNSEKFGIDLSESMLALAKAKAKKYKLRINLLGMDLEKLDFVNDFFDVVVGTFIFCTVANPISCLKEVRRVLKPEGKLYLLEHMRPDNKILGKLFDWVTPWVRWFGPNLNRKTIENLKEADFQIERVQNLFLGIYRYVIARPGK